MCIPRVLRLNTCATVIFLNNTYIHLLQVHPNMSRYYVTVSVLLTFLSIQSCVSSDDCLHPAKDGGICKGKDN
jgi:hypothetical protein